VSDFAVFSVGGNRDKLTFTCRLNSTFLRFASIYTRILLSLVTKFLHVIDDAKYSLLSLSYIFTRNFRGNLDSIAAKITIRCIEY